MPTPLSRREILTLLLGASLSAWACQRHSPRTYTGHVIGGDKTIGHRIIDSSGESLASRRRCRGRYRWLWRCWSKCRLAPRATKATSLCRARIGVSSGRHVVLRMKGIVPYPWAAHARLAAGDFGFGSLRRGACAWRSCGGRSVGTDASNNRRRVADSTGAAFCTRIHG